MAIHLPIDCERQEAAEKQIVVELNSSTRAANAAPTEFVPPANTEQWTQPEVKKSA